ncbi:hypoxanthine phosphoribosyltransferase [Patescibacteria group bacterium]|nr:hypoxanthine phosphoribosyltransferase [Patescibacteria group bacterium]
MKLLYTREEIEKRTREVGKQISKDHQGKDLLIIGVLKGCVMWLSHLLIEIEGNTEIDFMTVSSYMRGTESGELKLVQDLDTVVKNRDVLIVEDIVDTGKTLKYVYEYLKSRGARSIEIATFVNKMQRRQLNDLPEVKYIAFEYDEPEFLIGYGFDYKQRYRNLPAVYKMEESDFWDKE